MPRHAVGLDFGTLAARALVVDVDTGATHSFEHIYRHGILGTDGDSAVARQQPSDYIVAAHDLLALAAEASDEIVGIGIDATASTPIPVDSNLQPIADRFPNSLDAKSWLWKDHSSQAEADEITETMREADPERLARVGAYYAEWFWAKILRCTRQSPEIAAASHTWLEQCDFVTANLTGSLKRGKCAAGHKALYHNGYPNHLPAELHRIAAGMGQAFSCSEPAGGLTPEWSAKTGIRKGTPIAVGGVDAHLGAVGAGIGADRVCLVLGTSACHMAVAPYEAGIKHVPGISGVADDSVIPGMLGLEAGQAAFGDLLDWAARNLGVEIDSISREAEGVPPGSNGLLVLDFHSGNRCPLADARLAGVMLGQTLATKRAESFRAVVEALAFGIRQIIDMFRSAVVPVIDLVACGGVAENNPFVLQTISDVTGLRVHKSTYSETVALGAAIFGSVVGGSFQSVQDAQRSLCKIEDTPFVPNEEFTQVYDRLYPIWVDAQRELGAKSNVLKRLLGFKEQPQY
jgi:L-ribulokinase